MSDLDASMAAAADARGVMRDRLVQLSRAATAAVGRGTPQLGTDLPAEFDRVVLAARHLIDAVSTYRAADDGYRARRAQATIQRHNQKG